MATTMNISLPEALRDFVEEAVNAGGYSSVSEYMRELVRQAKSEKDLEDRLLAALDSADLGPANCDCNIWFRDGSTSTTITRD